MGQAIIAKLAYDLKPPMHCFLRVAPHFFSAVNKIPECSA